MSTPSVILSYGLGVDSTALLLRWLLEPSSRDFDLADLLVVTACTGDEWEETHSHVEQHIAPRLAEHGVRWVQLSRAGFSQADGIAVLDDSRSPQISVRRGPWSLSADLTRNGVVPLVSGTRRCSQKAKAWPITTWLKTEIHGAAHRMAFGFETTEQRRADEALRFDTDDRTSFFPLIDWGWDRDACERYILEQTGVAWRKSACAACFPADTQVVTSTGVKPIGDLAGRSVELLVPAGAKYDGLQARGTFRSVPVRSFGEQRLYRIELNRGRARKVVHATAEHEWILAPASTTWRPEGPERRRTIDLVKGDRLRTLRATPPVKEIRMDVAVAQGFVFGDGSRGRDRRPAYLSVYDNGKDPAILPFFAGSPHKKQKRAEGPTPQGVTVTAAGANWTQVSNLPRFWKDAPPLNESRAFLLSWLAGYFAADGTVTKMGQATLYSARQEHVEIARDVAAICGVGYSPVRMKMRKGVGGVVSALWQLDLRIHDLPSWFFLIEEHALRVADALERRGTPVDTPWKVLSVTETDRVEEVFCATVDGVGAFGLADDLMTGNCPFALTNKRGRIEGLTRMNRSPQEGAAALLLERRAVALNPRAGLVAGERLHDLAREQGRDALLSAFRDLLEGAEHALYEVRRLAPESGMIARSVEVLDQGECWEMELALAEVAERCEGQVDNTDGLPRIWLHKRANERPWVEHFFVVGPVGAESKARAAFNDMWDQSLAVLG